MSVPKLPKPPQSVILPSSLLLDPTKEPLTIVQAPYFGITHVPTDLAIGNGPDLMMFVELNKCFKKANQVAEGMLANVLWGFEQCGYDPRHVAAGLTELRKKGYLLYTDEGRVAIAEFNFDPKKPVWIRYTKKFTDLLIKESRLILT
jgi:formylmethanofuran dehydrogenase subunit E